MVRVVEAKHLKDYIIWLRFSDGTEGEVDLSGELYGEVFEPLKDKEYFKSFIVHPDWHTIAWPKGADFAPEFLHSTVQVHA
jgi:hypothetical protein